MSARQRLLQKLRDALRAEPPNNRASFARGWVAADRVFYKPQRRLKKNEVSTVLKEFDL